MDNQPIYISEKKQKTPQEQNILAAKLVADTIRSTLGPKGMDKLLVDQQGNTIITNDGVTILSEMEIKHPIANMIVDIAKTQEIEVGDGTTTAVILAGELLSQAQDLLNRNLHPTSITKGYQLAAAKAQEILLSKAKTIDPTNVKALEYIVSTAMTGKGAEVAKESLAKLIVQAATSVKDKDAISVIKHIGGSIEDSRIIAGLVLNKHRVHPDMPTQIPNAKIALLNCPLEVRDTETDAKISITNPAQMQAFIEQEEIMVQNITSAIINSGANVVFCQRGIDDLAQYHLAKAGISAIRRATSTDMRKLAKATGAKLLYDVKDLNEEVLGRANVEEKDVNGETMLHITNVSGVATIVVGGGTNHVADEVVRAVDDALGDVFSVLKSNKIVPGAGAIEVELAKELLIFAKTLSGREQLAAEAFANSLLIVPKTLAQNAGLDPIDVVAQLNAAHETSSSAGIDVFTGKVLDSYAQGIIEPLHVKVHAISSASEVANMILRIDDVIATQIEEQQGSGPNLQMPPGY
jgi:thermosome